MSKFVRIPKRGDIAVNELTTHKTMYIPREQYNANQERITELENARIEEEERIPFEDERFPVE